MKIKELSNNVKIKEVDTNIVDVLVENNIKLNFADFVQICDPIEVY